ncbi:MAG: C4-dicarboxylate TRAP transporter substrate-binding protein [Bradyrhizobiaceae bacterium]|nr:C4-dicarboxylate TRAP transporter substrate-binding protein [Bradyrhizobiaceae bacterium]
MYKVAVKSGLVAGAVLLATSTVFTSPVFAQQEINLTVAAGQPTRAMRPLAMVETFFVPEVDKRMAAAGLDKKYKINWKQAYAGSLLKPTFVLQGVSDGIADIGFEPTIFHPDKLPLEQISFATPFVTSDVVLVGKTIDKLHATVPAYKAQYDKFGVVRLAGSSFDSYELFTTFPVKKFEDIKGKKLSTAGAALQWIRDTGATPVDSNMTLYYNNAKTGVIDGFIIFPSANPGMKYSEAAPYVTKVGFGAQYAAALIINKGVYDKLPPEVRKILHEVATDWTAAADKIQQEAGDTAFDTAPKNFAGAQNFVLPRDEQVKWANALPNIAKEWAARIDKQSLPGSQALTAYMEEMRKAGAKPVRDWDKK